MTASSVCACVSLWHLLSIARGGACADSSFIARSQPAALHLMCQCGTMQQTLIFVLLVHLQLSLPPVSSQYCSSACRKGKAVAGWRLSSAHLGASHPFRMRLRTEEAFRAMNMLMNNPDCDLAKHVPKTVTV
jgi:hypothetical protein